MMKMMIYFILFHYQLRWTALINYQLLNLIFIVPINKNMTKIKIDFFIMPKATQQNRSAKFIIQDINSNKIYIKYYSKNR